MAGVAFAFYGAEVGTVRPCRYYSLDISYFKSSTDGRLLDSLWNKYWVNTLSSSTLLTVSDDGHAPLLASVQAAATVAPTCVKRAPAPDAFGVC